MVVVSVAMVGKDVVGVSGASSCRSCCFENGKNDSLLAVSEWVHHSQRGKKSV